MSRGKRDHGGGLDAAIHAFGGVRADWIDLSTGINPAPYPIPAIPQASWTELPDEAAQNALIAAARSFWHVPEQAGVLPAPGASALIAALPRTMSPGRFFVAEPTYNEHKAAFLEQGWTPGPSAVAQASAVVHPNNPDGRQWRASDLPRGASTKIMIIDESFCDTDPEQSLIAEATKPGTIILKSFGKFWGLAGLRLGFAIGDPELLNKIERDMGPWAVSGPAQTVGTAALADTSWANETRTRLFAAQSRLDDLMTGAGANTIGGTPLFRLYHVDHAEDWQNKLARKFIWSRVFPYNAHWLRLGIPPEHGWARLASALE